MDQMRIKWNRDILNKCSLLCLLLLRLLLDDDSLLRQKAADPLGMGSLLDDHLLFGDLRLADDSRQLVWIRLVSVLLGILVAFPLFDQLLRLALLRPSCPKVNVVVLLVRVSSPSSPGGLDPRFETVPVGQDGIHSLGEGGKEPAGFHLQGGAHHLGEDGDGRRDVHPDHVLVLRRTLPAATAVGCRQLVFCWLFDGDLLDSWRRRWRRRGWLVRMRMRADRKSRLGDQSETILMVRAIE